MDRGIAGAAGLRRLRPPRSLPAAALLGAFLAVACATDGPDDGLVHVVQPGETVWRIAHHYGVPVSEVLAANEVDDVHDVAAGTRLWIPHGRPGAGLPLRPVPARAGPPEPPEGEAFRHVLRFAWPLRGRVSSNYGTRGRRPHEGIDIPASSGTPVRAAEAGRVVFAGRLGGYGNVVVLRHDDRFETVYAHNRRNRVQRLDFVDKGRVIAEVGATGNATGPHLHFEIRRDDRPEDPLRYLP